MKKYLVIIVLFLLLVFYFLCIENVILFDVVKFKQVMGNIFPKIPGYLIQLLSSYIFYKVLDACIFGFG